jgi:hypothetical protein
LEGLVKVRHFLATSNGEAAEILQLLYGFTKGPLVSKAADAINHGDTLDRYHQQVLDFFILPRVSI